MRLNPRLQTCQFFEHLLSGTNVNASRWKTDNTDRTTRSLDYSYQARCFHVCACEGYLLREAASLAQKYSLNIGTYECWMALHDVVAEFHADFGYFPR